MKLRNIILLILIGTTVLTSCDKFLETEPASSVSDDELFSSTEGFQQALTGVYSDMAARSLYGDNLTMGFTSILAQNYKLDVTNAYQEIGLFSYETSIAKGKIEDIWYSSYHAIAAINNLLTHLEEKKALFNDNDYNLMKGEALGLRAYLHFDLLRLFGKRYADGATSEAIPYRTQFNHLSKLPSSLEEVCTSAIADLDEAEDLLSSTDAILTGDLNRRFYMNYYAVIATKARIKQYQGKLQEAAAEAKRVIDGKAFRFVLSTEITATSFAKDRLFSKELIFALRVYNIADWATAGTTNNGSYEGPYFMEGDGSTSTRLTRTEADFKTLFEATVNSADYRYAYLVEADQTATLRFSSKYWQTWKTTSDNQTRLDQTVPLFRFSELYYILAQNAGYSQEGLDYLNTVRSNRGIKTNLTTNNITDASSFNKEVLKEYQKEFYAEGQLFFYYKLTGATTMQFNYSVVSPDNYILPIPDAEVEFNDYKN